ncbi:hypothetical protein ACHWQZ_G000389 [Mnemiopsis leidyi]
MLKSLMPISNAHGEISYAYGEISNAHGEISYAYGEISNAHGEISNAYGKICNAHGEISNVYGEISNAYGEISNAHGEISYAYGEISNAHGEISNVYGEISNAYGEFSNVYGEISNAYGEFKLLHKSGRVTFPSRFQAHRGGGGEWTENTMSAFKQAELLGVELFELDVQLTRDGEVVVCHDDNLSRVCGVNENISEHLLSTLPLCLREMEVACEPGEYMRCEVQQPLVRLEDLYKHFPSTPMQMDLKPGGHDLISKVSDLTKKYKREHLTIWGAFSHKTTVACREHNPDILSFCSMWECSFYPLIMLLGLLPWVPIQADFYQVPIPNISNKSGFLSTFPKWLCQLVTPLMCNPLLLWHLEKRGVRTGAWVMNHHHEYQTADWYGFGGIMTDFPSRFVQYENERKKME